MANPSLKAQIEAAKSALIGGQSAAIESTPKKQEEIEHEIVEESALPNDKSQFSETAKNSNKQQSISRSVAEIQTRLNSLESKLASNQKDLHQLLNKIGEVTYLKSGMKQKELYHETKKPVSTLSRYFNKYVVCLIALMIISSGVFYVTLDEQLKLHFSNWIYSTANFFNGWIG